MAEPQRALVVGALGRMGERVRVALAAHPALRLGAALESADHPGVGRELEEGVLVESDAKSAMSRCDVVIDFSVPTATLSHLRGAAEQGVAYVTGTTGLDAQAHAEIARLAKEIPVIHAANFSLCVNVLVWLAREAARKLGPGFDAELFEIHHGQKRDAPSGTALRLAEAVAEGRGHRLDEHLVLERAGETGARPEAAIGIQALRGGDNPGEHTVMFVGEGERIELVHRSATRDHFAQGAVRAAAWLVGRPPGLYRVEDAFGL